MKKEFSLVKDKAFINFTAKYCETTEQLLASAGFHQVLVANLKANRRRKSPEYHFLNNVYGDISVEEIAQDITQLLKMLTAMSAKEIIALDTKYTPLLENPKAFGEFVEDVYGYWRKLERYSVLMSLENVEGLGSSVFLKENANFTNLILEVYRNIKRHGTEVKDLVFRQLPAGANAGMILRDSQWPLPEGYEVLEDIPFISSIFMEAPFITYPKKTKRHGVFQETFSNPLIDAQMTKEHFCCYPAKVGELLGYIYFHRDLMAHGISLSNLFEMAQVSEYQGKKPDLIYVFGGNREDKAVDNAFYEDKENEMMVGFVLNSEKVDYFGYLKKMILTLHNLVMIKGGHLPIHGAMVHIKLKDGKAANVVIVGDSGAGKSESLEALRSLSEEHISDMVIIFDDMGSFQIRGNRIYGYGTETGAFVRLDDLDQGYAFKEIDRSIFMNPDKTNARLVMPVSDYSEIIHGYPVDLVLYANNYKKLKAGEPAIKFFDDLEEMKSIFRSGRRMTKGTTTEKGIVDSYFANPFGPVQRQEATDLLIDQFFDKMYELGVKIGEIYTQLGVQGMENKGPRHASINLFEQINKLGR